MDICHENIEYTHGSKDILIKKDFPNINDYYFVCDVCSQDWYID